MLLSDVRILPFTPLFASAAQVTCNKTNCVLAEAPKFKVAGADDSTAVSDLVLPFNPNGYTWSDVEVVGGKLTYNGEAVDGIFKIRDTYLDQALVIGVQSMSLRMEFVPTDTVNFKKATWTSSASNPIPGWPSLTVEGLPAMLAEAPTVGKCISGKSLSTVTITGGKVVDTEGNDITSQGAWTFKSTTLKPTVSGDQVLTWVSDNYSTVTVSVYVEVGTIGTTLGAAPSFQAPPGKRISAYVFRSNLILSSGVVLDENGTDVTANETWTIVDTPENLIMMKSGELKFRWTATGYESVETLANIEILTTRYREFDKNWYIQQEPVMVCPDDFVYSPEGVANGLDGIISYTPGVMVDEDGNEVAGTWGYYSYPAGVTIGTKNVSPIFTPADTTCPPIEDTEFVNQRDSLTILKADYDITEDFEIVLQYGVDYTMPLQKKDLAFSNITLTQGLQPYRVSWSKSVFDPKTADYNSVTYVDVTISLENATFYNSPIVRTVPVRIQPYTIGSYSDYMATTPRAYVRDVPSLGLENDAPNGMVTINVDFTTTRLKGDYVVRAFDGTNTFDVMTIKPDENGRFTSNLAKWQAPANGTYTFTFTYVPSAEDSAVFADEALKTYTYSQDVEVNIRQKRNVTVKMGSETYKTQVFEGDYETISLAEVFTGSTEGYIKWIITDENGKAATYTPSVQNIAPDEFRSHIQIGEMPAHDLVFTASKTENVIIDGDGDVVEGGGLLDQLLAFWNKIVSFIVKVYQAISNIFKF